MASQQSPSVPELKREVELLELSTLHLDTENPRFGGTVSNKSTEVELLDTIVEKFGVDDLLSSLSMNGYFGSEPLVGYRATKTKGSRRPVDGEVTIAEGNRRLTACLILEGDPRAKNQKERTTRFNRLGRPPITKVPVLVYEDKARLLSFMGVRHIAAQNPWDSFAKAYWVAQMLADGAFSLDQIIGMIGDQHHTIERMLEGYYFVKQLRDADKWDPTTSMRPGRGSNPKYPFSWVYTALSFSGTRSWLELDRSERREAPIPTEHLDRAAEFLGFMFGNTAKKLNPAITDSREIVDLASAVKDTKQLVVLRRGVSLHVAQKEGLSSIQRLEDGLGQAKEALLEISGTLASGPLDIADANRIQPLSKQVRSLAISNDKSITKVIDGDDEAE